MKILIIVLVLLVAVVLVVVKTKRTKPTTIDPNSLHYTQLDVTERFDENLKLKPNEWINTIPLNKETPEPQRAGLPPVNASDEEVYRIAASLSKIREQFPIPNDGVYCPICHIACMDLQKLHEPCPRCKRLLLKFGWD